MDLCKSNPLQLWIGSQELSVNDQITQNVLVVHNEDKLKTTLDLLSARFGDKVVIFC